MSLTVCGTLEEMRRTCSKHQHLRDQFTECLDDLKQNEAQHEILRETAAQLEKRHALIRNLLDSNDSAEAARLEQEVDAVGRQVRVWIKELHDVHDRRVEIDCRMLRLNSELKKNATCVQLANIDVDLLQSRHDRRWKCFLKNNTYTDAKL